MTCETFRAALPEADSPAALQHLRECDECMNVAIDANPDLLFRSIGGDELVPPGGIDAFVSDVMREVQIREAARSMVTRRRVSPWYGLGAAAALTTAFFTYSLNHRPYTTVPTAVSQVARISPTVTRPVIESYDNSAATIVEVPTDDNTTKIVMVFDETLPADL